MQVATEEDLNSLVAWVGAGESKPPTSDGQWAVPAYHDPTDSNISRLYNSSPTESPLGPGTESPGDKSASAARRADVPPLTGDSNSIGDEVRAQENYTLNEAAKAGKASEPTARSGSAGTPAGPESGAAASSLQVERVAVRRRNGATPAAASALTAALSASGHNLDEEAVTGPSISLRVYLPSRDPLDVTVSADANARDLIGKVLRTTRRKEELAALPGSEENYELRMHEGGGVADEDFPALDAEGTVADMLDDDDPTLCLLPSAAAPPPQEDGAGGGPGQGTGRKASDPITPSPAPREDGAVLVHISHESGSTKRYVAPDDTMEDVLHSAMVKGHAQPGVEYVFFVSEEDRARLQRPSAALAMTERKRDLPGVEALTLQRKRFRDEPGRPRAGLDRSGRATSRDGAPDAAVAGARAGLDPLAFSNAAAALYKDWMVTKINHRGRHQRRILGIDHSKIYNQYADEGQWRLRSVKRPERPMSDVVRAQLMPSHRLAFSITFKAPHEGTTKIDYLADREEDAVEIVSKIQYIRTRLHGAPA